MNNTILLSIVTAILITGCSNESDEPTNVEPNNEVTCETRMFCSTYPMPTCDKHAFICYEQELCKNYLGETVSQLTVRTEPFDSCASGKAACCDEMCAPRVNDDTEAYCEKPFVSATCDCDVNVEGCLPDNCKVINGYTCCQF